MAPGILHGWMTRDALLELGLTNSQIRGVIKTVTQVDRGFSHPRHSNHRVEKYQREFERYGGRVCLHEGAEWQAARFLSQAQESWIAGNQEEAKRRLGYAIHFIQDALCPEHVFPFTERLGLCIAHLNYELYITMKYRLTGWPSLVRNAPVIQVSSLKDLRRKVEEAADWVSSLPCSYIRQDRQRVRDNRTEEIPLSGWQMSDEDIGRWMERASSLVKGSVAFVISSKGRLIMG